MRVLAVCELRKRTEFLEKWLGLWARKLNCNTLRQSIMS